MALEDFLDCAEKTASFFEIIERNLKDCVDAKDNSSSEANRERHF